ncbi:MAG: GNAT family N-acetyltransferase [Bacteroidota bacterium]
MKVREATIDDIDDILLLYRDVAHVSGGIIRLPQEVDQEYISDFVKHSIESGLILLVESESGIGLKAEIHAYQYGLKAFRHILGDLTIVVHPDCQGQGLGKQLFSKFLEEVQASFNHIHRVELFVREQNAGVIKFYESIGFRKEGRFIDRIIDESGAFETPVPMAWFNPAYQA